ncbi:mCG146999, partial [Mus musculus]
MEPPIFQQLFINYLLSARHCLLAECPNKVEIYN